jgi:CBS domain containing-hemolysin-like protein
MTALLIIAGLILVNGLFVAAEFAIVGAPRPAIDAKAARGHRLARAVQAVLRDPRRQDRYIATAQLGITAASLGLGMYGEHAVAHGIERALAAAGLPAALPPGAIASVLAVTILTYFHIVLGEMVPKSLALQYADRMALWITPPMLWTKNLLFPIVVTLNGLGNLVLKGMGVNRFRQTVEQYYTPEELQLIVRESEELGALRGESGRMLQEIFEFGDLTAGQVMVPRVRIVGIPLGTTAAELRELLGESPHTRYPVFDRDLDHIVGVMHMKDVLRVLLTRGPCRWCRRPRRSTRCWRR